MPAGKNHPMFGKHHSEETKKHWSLIRKGRKLTEEQKLKIALKSKGNKHKYGKHATEETKRKMSLSQMGKRKGKKCNFWIDGRTPKNKLIRRGVEFRLWREAVFARDNWTCQKYGTKGGNLHPHHIQNFSQFPELRFAIDNGITLSEKAHKEFHKKYGHKNNTKEQINEFLTLQLI